MDLSKYGTPISEETVQQTEPEVHFVFPDSDFLPLNATYEGDIEKDSRTSKKVPYRVFSNGAIVFLASKWNKQCSIPIPLEKGKKCRLYNDKEKGFTILNLESDE